MTDYIDLGELKVSVAEDDTSAVQEPEQAVEAVK